jgi:phosphatidylglycerophosphate synthase
MPAWVTVLVIARDLIILTIALVSYLALGTRRFQPNLLSKVNTIVQVVTAIGILASGVWLGLVPLVWWLPYAAAASTLASGVSYLHERAVQVEQPGNAGPPAEG